MIFQTIAIVHMHVYLQYNIHYVFVIIRHREYVLFVSISAKFDQLADLN